MPVVIVVLVLAIALVLWRFVFANSSGVEGQTLKDLPAANKWTGAQPPREPDPPSLMNGQRHTPLQKK
jgi:hypothetical protein